MDSEQPETATSATTTPGGRSDQEGGRSDRPQAAESPQELTASQRVEFSCIRNATYHEDRADHFAFLHRGCMFLVVALGTASIGGTLATDNKWATTGTAVAVLAGLFDLLWNVDGMARLHSNLRSRCYDLLARLEGGEPPEKIKIELLRMVGEEPPAMYAVDALAFNRAVDAMGRPPGQKYHLGDWQVLIRNIWRFRPNGFPTLDELAQRKSGVPSSA